MKKIWKFLKTNISNVILFIIIVGCFIFGCYHGKFTLKELNKEYVSYFEIIIEAIFLFFVLKEFKMTRKSFEWQKEEWVRQREKEYCRRINVIKKWLYPQCYNLVKEYNNELLDYAKQLKEEIISISYKKEKEEIMSSESYKKGNELLMKLLISSFSEFKRIDEEFFKKNKYARIEYENKKKQFEKFTEEKKEKLKKDLMNWILSELECKNECEEVAILEKIITLQIGRFVEYDNSFDELINKCDFVFPIEHFNTDIMKMKYDYIKSDFSKEEIIAQIGIEYNTIEDIYNRVIKKYK